MAADRLEAVLRAVAIKAASRIAAAVNLDMGCCLRLLTDELCFGLNAGTSALVSPARVGAVGEKRSCCVSTALRPCVW